MLVCNATSLLMDIEDLLRGRSVECSYPLTKVGTQSTCVVLSSGHQQRPRDG